MPEKETNPNPTFEQSAAYCFAIAEPINAAINAAVNGFNIPPYEKAIGILMTALNVADQMLGAAMRGENFEAARESKALCSALSDVINGISISAIATGETVTPYDVDAYLKAVAQAAEVAAV